MLILYKNFRFVLFAKTSNLDGSYASELTRHCFHTIVPQYSFTWRVFEMKESPSRKRVDMKFLYDDRLFRCWNCLTLKFHPRFYSQLFPALSISGNESRGSKLELINTKVISRNKNRTRKEIRGLIGEVPLLCLNERISNSRTDNLCFTI